jgi:exonuclease VII small subunit
MQPESQQYEKAIEEFKEAAELYRQLELKMDEAKVHRL